MRKQSVLIRSEFKDVRIGGNNPQDRKGPLGDSTLCIISFLEDPKPSQPASDLRLRPDSVRSAHLTAHYLLIIKP